MLRPVVQHLGAKIVGMAQTRGNELETIETRMAADSVKGGPGAQKADWQRAHRLRGELAVIDEVAGAISETADELSKAAEEAAAKRAAAGPACPSNTNRGEHSEEAGGAAREANQEARSAEGATGSEK